MPVDEPEVVKTLDDYFFDWESHAFGFGYGSGEPFTIPALRRFMELVVDPENPNLGYPAYDYRVLERELTPTVAWLLINALGNQDVIDYGSSPRFAWLNEKGVRLRAYMLSKTADDLVEIVTQHDQRVPNCHPDCCNCGPDGYDAKAVCPNPFWRKPQLYTLSSI